MLQTDQFGIKQHANMPDSNVEISNEVLINNEANNEGNAEE